MIEDEQVCAAPPATSTAWEALLADPPWNAKSFIAAGAATIGGLASWIGNFTSPVMAEIGGSYLGGFLLGWAFRRALKLAAMMAAMALAGVALMKASGLFTLDWHWIESQVSDGLRWLHGEAEGIKTVLSGFLPSAGAAGAGSFFGFRKK